MWPLIHKRLQDMYSMFTLYTDKSVNQLIYVNFSSAPTTKHGVA